MKSCLRKLIITFHLIWFFRTHEPEGLSESRFLASQKMDGPIPGPIQEIEDGLVLIGIVLTKYHGNLTFVLIEPTWEENREFAMWG